MIKMISIAALSIGLATSAFAAGGMKSNDTQTQTDQGQSMGTDNTTTNSTSMGVNGQNGAVGANSSNSSTERSGTKCMNGGADAKQTGTMTTNPQTSSGGNGTGTCQ